MDFFICLLVITIFNLKTYRSHPVPENESTADLHPGDYPFHCVIRIRPGINDFLLCEGAIIDEKWALTAAGCVDKYKSNPELLEIIAGTVSTENFKLQSHIQVRKVSQINFSPSWTDSEKKSGDIALIQFQRKLKFNRYVNFATFGKNLTTNETVQMIGYGESETLTSIKLKLDSSKKCLQKKDNPSELFCAKKNNTANAAWDTSFAGAPLTKMNTGTDREIFAIFSAIRPGKFINLAFHKPWIENTAKIGQSNTQSTTQSSTSSDGEYKKSSDDVGMSGGSDNSTNTSSTPSAGSDDEDEDEEADSSESRENLSTQASYESEELERDSLSDETSDETRSDEFNSNEENSTEGLSDKSTDETSESESDESDEEATTTSLNSTKAPSSSTSTPMNSTTKPFSTSTSITTISKTTSNSGTTSSMTTLATTSADTDESYDDFYDDGNKTTSSSSHNHNSDHYDNEVEINALNFANDMNTVISNSALSSSKSLLITSLASKAKSLISSFKQQSKHFFAIL